MHSNTTRALAGLAVIVVAIVLLIVLKDNGNTNDTTVNSAQAGSGGDASTVPTIVIENGKPVGGVAELTYSEGDRIRFKVDSDVTDEIHVHGYDLMKDVKAGGTVSFDFPATIEGVFEAELEGRGEQIAELTVNP